MPGLVRKNQEDDEKDKDVAASDERTIVMLDGKKLTDEQFNQLTVGQVLTMAAEGDHNLRRKLLQWEKKGKKREPIILPLVNWNSSWIIVGVVASSLASLLTTTPGI